MARLVATEAFGDRLPLEGRDIRVVAHDPGPIWLIRAGRGEMPEVAGMDFPAPGQVADAEGRRLIWVGPGQALLTGGGPPDGLTCVDQSDGWATARIEGAAGPDVLARLVPLDLRAGVFAPGTTARTLIGHMTGSVSRVDETTLEVMVMRSMAGTLVHDLDRAILTSAR